MLWLRDEFVAMGLGLLLGQLRWRVKESYGTCADLELDGEDDVEAFVEALRVIVLPTCNALRMCGGKCSLRGLTDRPVVNHVRVLLVELDEVVERLALLLVGGASLVLEGSEASDGGHGKGE